jgi:hypothetical protein
VRASNSRRPVNQQKHKPTPARRVANPLGCCRKPEPQAGTQPVETIYKGSEHQVGLHRALGRYRCPRSHLVPRRRRNAPLHQVQTLRTVPASPNRLRLLSCDGDQLSREDRSAKAAITACHSVVTACTGLLSQVCQDGEWRRAQRGKVLIDLLLIIKPSTRPTSATSHSEKRKMRRPSSRRVASNSGPPSCW